jgi:hypothetical protein
LAREVLVGLGEDGSGQGNAARHLPLSTSNNFHVFLLILSIATLCFL